MITFPRFFFQNLLQVLSSSIAIISSHVYLIRAFRGNGYYPDLQSKFKSGKQDSHFEPVGVFSLECFLYVLHPLCERTFWDKI